MDADPFAALALATSANAGKWGDSIGMLALLFGVFLALTSLLLFRERTWKELRLRAAACLVLVAGGGFLLSMERSAMPEEACLKASTDPQILRGLYGDQVASIRAGCAVHGIEIGEVRL